MIGRGSRILDNKSNFKVLDLGNNMARFGPWSQPVDWHHVFKYPDIYLENLREDEDIERDFVYIMPDSLKNRFKKSKSMDFDIKVEYGDVIKFNI